MAGPFRYGATLPAGHQAGKCLTRYLRMPTYLLGKRGAGLGLILVA
ncbi:MAG TPA: hypothetical protein VFD59_16810 [Nocardioidaceae bacterium]|nr:hypothetical protein [Nocardioidaceae bacterium]